uniref:Zgc:112163 n=1 Tax=Neogobius melanostomus TaxID=47308 RepID=A0A8C6SDV9_9GOBI
MTSREIIVAAAKKYLSTRKKSLSLTKILDLFAQVLAVGLGLKPALLYDANNASTEQVQLYLSSLQSSQLVSKSLFTLDLNGNTLIVNQGIALSHLNEILSSGNMGVVDVSHLLEMPVLHDLSRVQFVNMVQKLKLTIERFQQHGDCKPLYAGEQCEDWNLCMIFGLLLGYPVTYWFDQNKSYENCLSMTTLMVTKAAATWEMDAARPVRLPRTHLRLVPQLLRVPSSLD